MAIVQFGTPISGVRGTIGGITYSASKSGPNARAWSRGANPRSNLQSTHRARLAFMPALWRNLDPAQQADWDTFAALPAQVKFNSLNQSYWCSGYNWFTCLNTRLDFAGLTLLTDAPAGVAPAAPVITGLTFEDSGGAVLAQLTYGAGEFTATQTLVLFAAFIPSAGRQVQYSSYWNLAAIQNPGASPFDFSTAFVSRYGTPQAGDRLFIRVFKQSDEGQRSPEFADYIDYT